MSGVWCGSCGRENPAGGKFCKYCGSALPQPPAATAAVICPGCGKTLPAGSGGFCKYCGARLTPGGTPPEAPVKRAVKPEKPKKPKKPKKTDKPSKPAGSAKRGRWIVPALILALLLAACAAAYLNRDALREKWDELHGRSEAQGQSESRRSTREDDEPGDAEQDGDAEDDGGIHPPVAENEAEDGEQQTVSGGEEAQEQLLTTEQAAALIEAAYNCRAVYRGAADGAYLFDCFDRNRADRSLGAVSLDSRTGEMTVVSGMEPLPESRVPAVDMAEIGKLVSESSGAAEYSFALVDLATGDMAGSDNMYTAMSSSVLIDIPILYTIAAMVDRGELSLDDTVTFTYRTGGRGELTAANNGSQYTVSRLLAIMFRSSDNNATNSFMDFLGMGVISQYCRDAGYESVSVANYIGSTTDYSANDNYVSAFDLCGMLYELYAGEHAVGREFLEENLNVRDASGNPGLGKNISADNMMNFNGIKNTKYNEVIIVRNGDSAYAAAFLGNHEALAALEAIAAKIGVYVQGVMTSD